MPVMKARVYDPQLKILVFMLRNSGIIIYKNPIGFARPAKTLDQPVSGIPAITKSLLGTQK